MTGPEKPRSRLVGIQPDDYTPEGGREDASSPRWATLLEEAGHRVQWVDVRRADILDQLEGCDGFMWRHGHIAEHRQIARRLLPVLERELGMVVYPDQHTCWHYDDKIIQQYLFRALGVATPQTWVWFDPEKALEWARAASYPLVLKLWTGASSENVKLVQGPDEAELWIRRLFGPGVGSLREAPSVPTPGLYPRLRTAAAIVLKKRYPRRPVELHKDYVMFQEFIADNPHDTRIVVIGRRAFGFRRLNRDGDFRASGSGKIIYDRQEICMKTVSTAFAIAKRMKLQCVAFDFLQRGDVPLLSEISYTFVPWAIHDCPGHWELEGTELQWHAGQMWPEEAQIEDFLARLDQKRSQPNCSPSEAANAAGDTHR
jgi:glutathione synthase/RimK-type ligase-like ATP-grasp enzyme